MRRAGHIVPIQLSTLAGFLESVVAAEHLGQQEGQTLRAQRCGPIRRKLLGGSRDVAAGPEKFGLRWCFSARRLDVAPARQLMGPLVQ